MRRTLDVTVGGLVSVGLIVVGLWIWLHAGGLAWGMTRPELVEWAIRGTALSAVACAQVVMLSMVAANFFRRDALGDLVKVLAEIVAVSALIIATGLAVVGR